jgi:hypothetical protein
MTMGIKVGWELNDLNGFQFSLGVTTLAITQPIRKYLDFFVDLSLRFDNL